VAWVSQSLPFIRVNYAGLPCSLPKRNLVFPTQNSISENEQVVTIHNTLLIIQKIQMHMYLPRSRAKQTLLLFEKMKTQQFISVIFFL